MSLWTAEDVAHATGGTVAGAWVAESVSIDTRTLPPRALYVALKGERMDGHDFVADALAKGAAAAMVSHVPPGVHAAQCVVVADTMDALVALGRAGRARARAQVVGVTGSVGKTSTKEMLRTGLAAHGAVFASAGNLNNHIGVPLNLANLPVNADFAVIEMGMNHAGEIAHLTRMARPHVAVITNVEAVHLEFFPHVEAIADAKAEIFEGLEPGGTAVLNRDNAHFARLAACAPGRVLSVGADAKADVRLDAYRAGLSGSHMVATVKGAPFTFTTRTIGVHWARTALSVLAVASALGLDVARTAHALAQFEELPGRGQLVPIAVRAGAVTLVDDSYNASPAAMRAAFDKLRELRAAGAVKSRLVAALGDMRELGEEGPALHAALAEALEGIDQVFTAGPLMEHLHRALPPAQRAQHVPAAMDLLAPLQASLSAGDVLLVKGSHGSEMYRLAAALKNKNLSS